ncbi:LOW QUALITY PROTEIN: uncharacterized protein LOC128394871 [Panonychus citri]|uniref:LOW QUALITY PROTEIN: uncharacterized protein LOC128394871 n=1 Tax=Panonychus citri TaxID=50023 RepID=UPI0023080DC9|nr:LOW QUALITY PROTEIN: uncharacterized protein LOC128394871 [Panonychus citri]
MLLLPFILCLVNFSLISSMSFMDFRPEISQGSRIIHASLTDKETGKVWQIEEKISARARIEGKIDVTSSEKPKGTHATIFYSYKSYDNNKRLVMQNNDCDLYLYKSDWDKMLPGVTKPMINMILLIGPSFFYRIADSRWKEENDTIIRGASMHKASTIISQKIKVTAYYKDQFGDVTEPNRIELNEYNPLALALNPDQEDTRKSLILDVYLNSVTSQELAELVQPTPGVGCPVYLQDNLSVPGVSSQKVHFIAKDTTNNKYSTLNEIHADGDSKILRLAETRLGFTNTYLYDYNLGVRYTLSSSGECKVSPADLSSPGISINGYFSIATFLWLDSLPVYLGQIIFEQRSGLKVKVWESVKKDSVIESGKYDKVVTTIYLSSSVTAKTFTSDMIVGASRNAYRKDSSGNLQLIESIQRDFYDFEIDLPDSEYESAFKLGDCFAEPDKRLTLTLHITCDKGKKSNCIKRGEIMTIEMRKELRESIDFTYGISPLRIVDVEFIFSKDRIEADVTFVEAPSIIDSFELDYKYTKISSIKKYSEISAKSAEECIKKLSSSYSTVRAILFCENEDYCVSTENPDIPESTTSSKGTYCSVFTFPLKNLMRVGQEKSLVDIHNNLLAQIIHDEWDLNYYGETYTYEIVDVVAADKRSEEKERELYKMFDSRGTLTPNGLDIVEVPSIKRFSDCYRACSKSEDIFCETFTFCDADSFSCIVSSLSELQITNNLTSREHCKTYSKNYLSDYTPQINKAYKVPTSVSEKLWVDDCASECAKSSECLSFEFCDGLCTFGGYYSESNTKFDSKCTIYTPKLSKKYQLTGSEIVTEVLHTELDLDMDQCAAFCFDYKQEDDDQCKSFNYCPKGKEPASCQLTKYSVFDDKTVTNQSTSCHNYQMKTKQNQEEVNQDNLIAEKPNVRTTGVGAFGIIVLFMLIGLIVGFVGPYSVMKIKTSTILDIHLTISHGQDKSIIMRKIKMQFKSDLIQQLILTFIMFLLIAQLKIVT